MTYQFLDPLARPLVQAAIIAAFGLTLLVWRRYRAAAAVVLLAALWAWLCSTPAFATRLQKSLQSQHPTVPATSYPEAQVIVVLGGVDFPSSDHRSGAHGNDVSKARVDFGLRLYRAGRAPIILLSGGEEGAIRMAAILKQAGVPAAAIQTEERSRNTHENARYSATILKRENRQRVLLVTTAMHMPRAAASFRRQGLAVIPAPAPVMIPWLRNTQHAWWPQGPALFLTARCLHEYFGLWGYRLLGWA